MIGSTLFNNWVIQYGRDSVSYDFGVFLKIKYSKSAYWEYRSDDTCALAKLYAALLQWLSSSFRLYVPLRCRSFFVSTI